MFMFPGVISAGVIASRASSGACRASDARPAGAEPGACACARSPQDQSTDSLCSERGTRREEPVQRCPGLVGPENCSEAGVADFSTERREVAELGVRIAGRRRGGGVDRASPPLALLQICAGGVLGDVPEHGHPRGCPSGHMRGDCAPLVKVEWLGV
jgi:hypothetical protein